MVAFYALSMLPRMEVAFLLLPVTHSDTKAVRGKTVRSCDYFFYFYFFLEAWPMTYAVEHLVYEIFEGDAQRGK